MNDADLFGRRRVVIPERRQYQFEEKLLNMMFAVLHPSPATAVRNMRQEVSGRDGMAFWHFQQMFSFPMALAGYKLRRIDFLTVLRSLESTPIWTAWEKHLDHFQGSEFHGLFYESDGDGMLAMLLHNCGSLPLGTPHWRCTKMIKGSDSPLYLEPAAGAITAFQMRGWLLDQP